MSGDENLWYVKTADGDLHKVTLDQLDEAFQAGRIDGKVMVLAEGATKWQSLAELAGLDEAPAPAKPAVAPSMMPSSLRPVSLDLSLDLDENAFKKKSRKGLAIGVVVAAMAIFGGVIGANRLHLGSGSSTDTVAAAAPPPAAPPVTAAPPPDPTPPPAAAPAPAPSPAAQLNDDQKAKLAAADKALAAKTKKKTRGYAGGGGHASPKFKSQGFATGGAKGDPLSSTL